MCEWQFGVDKHVVVDFGQEVMGCEVKLTQAEAEQWCTDPEHTLMHVGTEFSYIAETGYFSGDIAVGNTVTNIETPCPMDGCNHHYCGKPCKVLFMGTLEECLNYVYATEPFTKIWDVSIYR